MRLYLLFLGEEELCWIFTYLQNDIRAAHNEHFKGVIVGTEITLTVILNLSPARGIRDLKES